MRDYAPNSRWRLHHVGVLRCRGGFFVGATWDLAEGATHYYAIVNLCLIPGLVICVEFSRKHMHGK